MASSASTKNMSNNNNASVGVKNDKHHVTPTVKTTGGHVRSKTPPSSVSRRSVTPNSRSHTRQSDDDAGSLFIYIFFIFYLCVFAVTMCLILSALKFMC